MKKFLSFTLVLMFLLVIFSACGSTNPAPNNSNTGDNNSNDTVSVTETVTEPAADDSITPADFSRTDYMTSKEAFVEIVGGLVDISLYDELEEYESTSSKSYSYNIKYENKMEYELDYSITISDGASFTMPISFADLEKCGWSLKSSSHAETEMEPGFISWAYCHNSAGQEIYVGAYNPTEETIAFGECSVCMVEFTMFDTTSETPEAYENTPGFTVCGGITHASTLEDIISVLGAPESFYYSIHTDENGAYEDSYIELTYEQASSAYDYLVFKLSGNGNYIISMEYQHIPE